MTGWRRLLAAMTLVLSGWVLFAPAPARADDISAAARSVVRVVTIAIVDQEVVGFGHGSGFAVGPNRIVTNAHVVELAQKYPDNVVIGVVPSQGSKSYQGRVIAIDTRKDLALIEVTGASLPPATLYTGSLAGDAAIVSLGYPGNVDVATAQSAADYIKPLAPVRSDGSLSASRIVNGEPVLLHTASIARGNSGGPALDRCGRVVGVNSAISRGEDGDANFAFALADDALIEFLRRAKQPVATVDYPCVSLETRMSADQAADAAAAEAAATARRDAAAKAQAARAQALEEARDHAERSAQNFMAIAALLLVVGALAVGAGGLLSGRGKPREARWAMIAGGVLIVLAVIVFLLRPGEKIVPPKGFDVPEGTPSATATAAKPLGKMTCAFIPDRSRITVSSPQDVDLDWGADGCLNGRTQYVEENGKWTRVMVPNTEATVSVARFDPATRTYTSLRYFLGSDQMDAIRKMRAQGAPKQCANDADALAALAGQQATILNALPSAYNEKLVYTCNPTP